MKAKRKRRTGTLPLSYPVKADVVISYRKRLKELRLNKEATTEGILIMVEGWSDSSLVVAQNIGQSEMVRKLTVQLRKEIAAAVAAICDSFLQRPSE